MSIYKSAPLSSLVSAVIDNRGRSAPTADAGIPLIATNCIVEDGLYPTRERIRFVSKNTFDTWFRGHPEPGDIILVNKGTPGRVCLVPDPVDFCIAQDMVAIRADDCKVEPQYLFAALRASEFKQQVEALHVGTMIPHLKKRDFPNLAIPLPTLEVQKAIGSFYINLSLKVELNRKMNRNLEMTSKMLFKSWFVDFDPVVAKQDGRPPSGMSPDVGALFPMEFQESDIGPIPKGWNLQKLTDVADFVKGKSYKSSELRGSDVALVTLKSFLRGGGYRKDGLKSYSGSYKSSQVLNPGEIIVACTDVTQNAEVIGRSALVQPTKQYSALIASLDVLIARPHHDTIPVSYLSEILRCDDYIEHILGYVNGTTVLHLDFAGLSDYRVAMPGEPILAAFDEIVQPFQSQYTANLAEIDTLLSLRDYLLPLLLSGRVGLKDANHMDIAAA